MTAPAVLTPSHFLHLNERTLSLSLPPLGCADGCGWLGCARCLFLGGPLWINPLEGGSVSVVIEPAPIEPAHAPLVEAVAEAEAEVEAELRYSRSDSIGGIVAA